MPHLRQMRLWGRTREQMGPEARALLDSQPPQTEVMGIILECWDDVATCRPIGMDVGPVPWTVVMDWCDRSGLDARAARLVWAVIHRVDVAEAEVRALEAKRG